MQTTTQPALSITPAPAAGFQLPCPCCGEACANIDLHLVDLTFTCAECSNDFTADDVRALIAKWTTVLAWVDAAPRFPSE